MASDRDGNKNKSTITRDQSIAWLNTAMASVGSGSYDRQLKTFWSCPDRFQSVMLPTNAEHSGLTFITRPYLNLSDVTLAQNRVLAPLLNRNSDSPGAAIRMILDTEYALWQFERADASPLVNALNPFNIPLGNGLTDISGFPDPYLQTETNNPGYHNEDQTIPIGGDNLNRTYDLTLSFRDVQGGPIAAIFMVWLEYMRMVTKGLCAAHNTAIDQRFLDYTVSIYRFVLDPTREYITRYARLVGCFPKSIPYGAMLTVNEGETFVNSIGKFSIPFIANKCIYDDYAILADFNRLVGRFAQLDDRFSYTSDGSQLKILPPRAENNYRGIPYIIFTRRGPKLEYIDPTSIGIQQGNLKERRSKAKDVYMINKYGEHPFINTGTGEVIRRTEEDEQSVIPNRYVPKSWEN